jgi:hypothetical protein
MFVLIGEGWHVVVPIICLTMEPQLRNIKNTRTETKNATFLLALVDNIACFVCKRLEIHFDPHVCIDKKENQIFLIYKEIQNGAVAKSYVTYGLLNIWGNICAFPHIRKPFLIYDFATAAH